MTAVARMLGFAYSFTPPTLCVTPALTRHGGDGELLQAERARDGGATTAYPSGWEHTGSICLGRHLVRTGHGEERSGAGSQAGLRLLALLSGLKATATWTASPAEPPLRRNSSRRPAMVQAIPCMHRLSLGTGRATPGTGRTLRPRAAAGCKQSRSRQPGRRSRLPLSDTALRPPQHAVRAGEHAGGVVRPARERAAQSRTQRMRSRFWTPPLLQRVAGKMPAKGAQHHRRGVALVVCPEQLALQAGHKRPRSHSAAPHPAAMTTTPQAAFRGASTPLTPCAEPQTQAPLRCLWTGCGFWRSTPRRQPPDWLKS